MVSRLLTLPAAAFFGLVAVDVSAQDAGRASPPRIVASLSECLAITADTQRLQCLDAAARAIDSAIRSGDLLIVDRQQATEARRQAFGTSSAPADFLPSSGTTTGAFKALGLGGITNTQMSGILVFLICTYPAT